jgi:hypothetical protein
MHIVLMCGNEDGYFPCQLFMLPRKVAIISKVLPRFNICVDVPYQGLIHLFLEIILALAIIIIHLIVMVLGVLIIHCECHSGCEISQR